MTNSDFRIFRLEGLVRRQAQLIADLQAAVGKLQQQQFQPSSSGGGGGGSSPPLYCNPTAIVAAALASSLTGQTIYQVNGGALTSVSTTGTIWNPYATATVATKKMALGQNNDGTYSVIDQEC